MMFSSEPRPPPERVVVPISAQRTVGNTRASVHRSIGFLVGEPRRTVRLFVKMYTSVSV